MNSRTVCLQTVNQLNILRACMSERKQGREMLGGMGGWGG